jgi:hypothetical protein
MSAEPTALWRVIRTEDRVVFDQANGPTPGKRVTYVLPDGSQSYIEVPMAQFNADTVRSLIEQAVVHIVDVMQLRGPDVPPPA